MFRPHKRRNWGRAVGMAAATAAVVGLIGFAKPALAVKKRPPPPNIVHVMKTNPTLKKYPNRMIINVPARKIYFQTGKQQFVYSMRIGRRDKFPSPSSGIEFIEARDVVKNPSWTGPSWAGKSAGRTYAGGAPGNPLKEMKIVVRGKVYIHGASSGIGRDVSHGCFGVSVADARDLYSRVQPLVAKGKRIPVLLSYQTIEVEAGKPGFVNVSVYRDVYEKKTNTLPNLLTQLNAAKVIPLRQREVPRILSSAEAQFKKNPKLTIWRYALEVK